MIRVSNSIENLGQRYFCFPHPIASAGSSLFTVCPRPGLQSGARCFSPDIPDIYRRKGGWAVSQPRLQPGSKALCRHQGADEAGMLLCTSFGCYRADSSKHLVLGGRAGPVEMKGCPC